MSINRYSSKQKNRKRSKANHLESFNNKSSIKVKVINENGSSESIDSIESRSNNLTILGGHLKGSKYYNNNNTSSGIDSFVSSMPLESPVLNSSLKIN